MNTLWENPPAVDHDRLTRDVACGVGGRETATLATSGLAVAPERDALQAWRTRKDPGAGGGCSPNGTLIQRARDDRSAYGFGILSVLLIIKAPETRKMNATRWTSMPRRRTG